MRGAFSCIIILMLGIVVVSGCEPKNATSAIENYRTLHQSPLNSPLISPLMADTAIPSPLNTPSSMYTYAATATASAIAYATAHAPTPIPPTSTAMPDGMTCYVNHIARFTLKLLPGWHTDQIWDKEYNVRIYNYYYSVTGNSEGPLPLGDAYIDMSVYSLEAGKSFKQWVSDRRAAEGAALPDTPITPTLSTPYSYTLGQYHGVAYTVISHYGDENGSFAIKLTDGKKIADIYIYPANFAEIKQVLKMLSTLDMSGNNICK